MSKNNLYPNQIDKLDNKKAEIESQVKTLHIVTNQDKSDLIPEEESDILKNKLETLLKNNQQLKAALDASMMENKILKEAIHDAKGLISIVKIEDNCGAPVDLDTWNTIVNSINEIHLLFENCLEFTNLRYRLSELKKEKELTFEQISNYILILSKDRKCKTRIENNHKSQKIFCDLNHLKRAIGNIYNNAARLSSNKEVVIEFCEDEQFDIIKVIDSGPGFEINNDGQVCLIPRVDQAIGESKNFGLGLEIAKQVCIAHGGKLELENRPLKGAIVTIKIPKE